MRQPRRLWAIALGALLVPSSIWAADVGEVPTDPTGRPLNLGFEDGTLRDWRADGEAFVGSVVEGDVVNARRGDMHSAHAGRFWVGSYEKGGDDPKGTLTSAPFRLSKPFLSFLIGGGSTAGTRAEVVRADSGLVIARASGTGMEDMGRVSFDLSAHLGKDVFVRLVDDEVVGWGHVNFDDVRLHDSTVFGTQRPSPDAFLHAGLSPEEAARAMTVPEGFKVTLFAGEPDVHQPIALAIDDRGRLWVAEAYSYPVRVPEAEAHDQILIFEDTDGDGHFDSRKVFADKLNLVSGIELGHGGVFVGAAPQLLFLPDRDGDDRPDGPAEVLLDGWGYQDTHETLNSFTWGPDGWLYGCHGVFTHSKVGKPGTPDLDRTPINAGIWRYHPTDRTFEVFSHGTSNPWGLTWNAMGQAFETACVIPHLYQMIPGGRYERQAGAHFNPYTFDDIKTIADHRHFVGSNPHAAVGKSSDVGGGHAHCGALIYQGGAWPDLYRDSVLMNNIHGARLNRDRLEPAGSGFVGKHADDFLMANDAWSQVISLKLGPDGQVYLIDWYDRQQCHQVGVKAHDRTNGRIFKVSYGPDKRAVGGDLKALPSEKLMTLLSDPNVWYAEHAIRLLAERAADPATAKAAAGPGLCADRPTTFRLRTLWARHAALGGKLDPETRDAALFDDDPAVRGWAIRLLSQGKSVEPAILAKFAEMAASDPSPVVRLELASALQRLPMADRWPIVEALSRHAEDANDVNLPHMVWYAFEPLAALDPARALAIAARSGLPNLLPFAVRRVAAIGSPGAIASVVDSLNRSETPARSKAILGALDLALKGKTRVDRPDNWPAAYARLELDPDAEVRSRALAIGLTFGDPLALKGLRAILADPKTGADRRLEALSALLKARDPSIVPTLQALVLDPDLRGPSIRGLAAFDDPKTPPTLLDAYPHLAPGDRRDALNALASRPTFALAMLDAVGSGRVPRVDLSADLVRQLRNLKAPAVDARVAEVWGVARDSSADKARVIAEAKARWSSKPARVPDPMLGRAVFARTCQQCHNLFGTGGNVGPELTGSNRADLDYLLGNVYDPSSLIGKDYQATVLGLVDGRTLTGIVRSEDADALTVSTANETLVVPKGQVEDRSTSNTSMMPEGLWDPLSDHEVRSLIAYLAGKSQAPLLASAETAAAFFNGRDLAGWAGDPDLWRVEGGEIVGRGPADPSINTFLRSDLAADDFRLTLDVKLEGNRGNSGIQFRSEPTESGVMRGDQADIGAGWWGKLFEEGGRGLIASDPADQFVRPGDWNRVEVEAVGPRVRVALNGHPCVDLVDPQGARRGVFGFQLHPRANEPIEVRFRNLRLEVLPPPKG